jgi:hypothetical protein
MDFRKSIRLYRIFSFTSMRANVDENLANLNNEMYTYRIHGSVYHNVDPKQPDQKDEAKFHKFILMSKAGKLIDGALFLNVLIKI